MARVLARLGLSAAHHPWRVIVAWLLILLTALGAMQALKKPLTSEFKLPGSEFGQVLDELGHKIPAASGGQGTVVFRTEHSGFTAEQRAAIAATEEKWAKLPRVTGYVDPFTTQARLDESRAKLADAERRLTSAQDKLLDGRYQLLQLDWLIKQGDSDIARIERTDPNDPTLDARRQGQVELRQLQDRGQHRLDDGNAELADGWSTYNRGNQLFQLSSGTRFVSEDGRTALGQVRFDTSAQAIPEPDRARIPEVGKELAKVGVQVDYGQEIVNVSELGGPGEIIGLIVAGIVLLVMLGRFVLAGMPLTVALVGVGVSLTLGLTVTHVVTLHQMAPVLGGMLGLAVGIDYALFIVTRHRRHLGEMGGEPSREQIAQSLGLAVGTAGSAVVVAGATVVIALAALCVSGIPLLIQMGLIAAFTVATTVAVALTLTPALLALAGRRAMPRQRTKKQRVAGPGWPDRWVGVVTRHPGRVVTAVVALLAVIALPTLGLRLGLPDGGAESPTSTAYQAFSAVEKSFGAGANGPIVVLADLDQPIPAGQAALQTAQVRVGQELAAVDGVTSVLPFGVSKDRQSLAFQLVSSDGPSSPTTVAIVDDLRGPVKSALARQGIDIGVTGQTTANIEVSQTLGNALPTYLLLVVGLSLLLLTMVFRSLVVPVLATGGFLLSVAAAFGAVVAVYQWGWLGNLFGVHHPEAILSFMPTLLIGILFGLAMDYQMFLVSGMRESYAHGAPAQDAVVHGFVSGARVVAAAALIMVSVFGGFVFAHMTMIRPIAFGLSVGVLIDAFLIRMTLTPAAMALLGERAWWLPGWLERLLPHLDVEGTSLERHDSLTSDEDESARQDVVSQV